MTFKPTIVDVEFISDDRAAIKAECGDYIGWEIVTHEEGMQVAYELNDRDPSWFIH